MSLKKQERRHMKLDPKETALLTLFQKGIFGFDPGADAIIPNASRVVEFVRKKQFQIIHVGLGFSEGHSEISDIDSPFGRVKQNNLFVRGTPSAEFHDAIARPRELLVYKQRVAAFSENQLHLILRSRGIENLVSFGIATRGAHDSRVQCGV
jgi:nicotinamidase-related amidase